MKFSFEIKRKVHAARDGWKSNLLMGTGESEII